MHRALPDQPTHARVFFRGVTFRAHKAAGLTTLQSHAYCEGMMVVVREQFAAGGAEGTETLVVCWSGQRQKDLASERVETSLWVHSLFTHYAARVVMPIGTSRWLWRCTLVSPRLDTKQLESNLFYGLCKCNRDVVEIANFFRTTEEYTLTFLSYTDNTPTSCFYPACDSLNYV